MEEKEQQEKARQEKAQGQRTRRGTVGGRLRAWASGEKQSAEEKRLRPNVEFFRTGT